MCPSFFNRISAVDQNVFLSFFKIGNFLEIQRYHIYIQCAKIYHISSFHVFIPYYPTIMLLVITSFSLCSNIYPNVEDIGHSNIAVIFSVYSTYLGRFS